MESLTPNPQSLIPNPLIAILGAAESGVGAALLAKKLGLSVFVSDKGAIRDVFKQELVDNAIDFEENQHSEDKILGASLVVKSPGIPDKAPLIQLLKQKNIEIISEIEFAARHCTAKIIAITGSNGKTTTTNLTYHLMKTAGLKVGIAGNIGFSFARKVATEDNDWYVLEISSFQLDDTESLHAHVSMLLNITPDHLDRYEYKMENYVNSKFRILQNQTKADYFIYNIDNPEIKNWLDANKKANKKLQPLAIPVFGASLKDDPDSDVIVDDFEFETEDLTIRGDHNLFNAVCAISAAKIAGCKNKRILEGLRTFRNAPHRLEYIATIDEVDYINDSKATNVDSVFYALGAMRQPVIWIAGGTDKGNDYAPLEALVAEKVKVLVCMGADNSKLVAYYKGKIPTIIDTNSLDDALAAAKKSANEGDVVLLSPACASFDLFKNYEDRGDLFRKAVLGMSVAG
jgi:UDP-N-acetylmuramoylalanine--D-glutamate ligase